MTKQVYRADIRPYQDRIAALESELAKAKAEIVWYQSTGPRDRWRTRAEKAEAEVERLNWMLDVHGCDRKCGGGHDSGGGSWSSPSHAAANPAAMAYTTEEGHDRRRPSRIRRAAARKERDG